MALVSWHPRYFTFTNGTRPYNWHCWFLLLFLWQSFSRISPCLILTVFLQPFHTTFNSIPLRHYFFSFRSFSFLFSLANLSTFLPCFSNSSGVLFILPLVLGTFYFLLQRGHNRLRETPLHCTPHLIQILSVLFGVFISSPTDTST